MTTEEQYIELEEIKNLGISSNKIVRVTERQVINIQDAQELIDSI